MQMDNSKVTRFGTGSNRTKTTAATADYSDYCVIITVSPFRKIGSVPNSLNLDLIQNAGT
jgi:hypothetical protein